MAKFGRGAWQANMARITGTFDGDIARITGINAQAEAAAAAAEQQRSDGKSWRAHSGKRRRGGGASLFNSRDAFAGTKLTENHMKVAKAHCATRHSKVTEVGEG